MRLSRLLVLAVLIVAAGVIAGLVLVRGNRQTGLSSAQDQEPLPPLVFVRDGNLWRSDGSRAAPRQLTRVEPKTHTASPAVSPDGSRIAYVLVGPPPPGAELPFPSSQLYVMRQDGNDAKVVWTPPQGEIGLVAWAPDGQSLFVGITGLRAAPAAIGGMRLPEIVRLDVDSGMVQPFLEDVMDPALSRDGTLLAYVRLHEGVSPEEAATMALEVSTTDGSQVHEVLGATRFTSLYAPRFSPDAKQIVFSAIVGSQAQEHKVPRDSMTASTLFEDVLAWLAPAAEAHGQPYDLWIVNTNGTELRRLTRLNEDQPMAVFAPDGKELAMIGAGGIYRLNVDGSALRKVDSRGGHGGLDWMLP